METGKSRAPSSFSFYPLVLFKDDQFFNQGPVTSDHLPYAARREEEEEEKEKKIDQTAC